MAKPPIEKHNKELECFICGKKLRSRDALFQHKTDAHKINPGRSKHKRYNKWKTG